MTHRLWLRNNDETFQAPTSMLTTLSTENSTPEKEFYALVEAILPKISLFRWENVLKNEDFWTVILVLEIWCRTSWHNSSTKHQARLSRQKVGKPSSNFSNFGKPFLKRLAENVCWKAHFDKYQRVDSDIQGRYQGWLRCDNQVYWVPALFSIFVQRYQKCLNLC